MGAADLLERVRGAGFVLDVADDKLLVTPASMLTDELRAALRACKPELIQLPTRSALGNDGKAVVGRTCAGCAHGLQRGACGEPVAAGLLTVEEGFGIVWPPERHGAVCPAFTGRMPAVAADQSHRLTDDEANRCNAPCWNGAETAAFTARTERFALLGRADADDLEKRLTLRDRDGDDRRLCLECTWLGDTGRCLAAATGRIPGADRRLEPAQTILQRCRTFGLRMGLA